MNCRSLFGVLALLPFAASAAEWAIEPSIESRANWTDNLNFTPGARESAWWLSLSPAVAFSRNTEVSQLVGSARLSTNRYPDNRTLDTDDQFFYLSSKLNNERNEWGLSATYNRDSTLQTELATTGIVQERRQRTQIGISPSWQYSLTERSSVFANYRYAQAGYEAGAGLTDYSNQQVSAGVQHLWNERTTLTLSGNHSRFETETGSQITNTSILSGGVTYRAGERLNLALSAGVRHSVIEVNSPILVCTIGSLSVFQCQVLGIPLVQINASSRVSDDGWVLDGSADYRWDRTSAGLVIGRDVNPTGDGLLVQTDRVGGTLKHEFSEKFFGNMTASVLQSRYLGALNGNKSTYYSLDGSLSWTLTEHWRLGTGYSHAYQKTENAPDNATANTVYLTIGYNWPRISISR